MQMESEGRQIHSKAVETLEHENDLEKALELVARATVTYLKSKDYQGAGEIQGVRMSIFKRLYRQTEDPVYLDLSLQAANDAVNISKRTGKEQDLVIPYRDLGKAYIESQRFSEAVNPLDSSFQILKQNPPERFSDEAVRAEVQAHLGFAQYMSGNKDKGRENLESAIETLKTQDRSYEVDVWLSGAYMRGAQMLHNDNKNKSEEYLRLAKEIIDSNPKLELRKEDWERLSERLAS